MISKKITVHSLESLVKLKYSWSNSWEWTVLIWGKSESMSLILWKLQILLCWRMLVFCFNPHNHGKRHFYIDNSKFCKYFSDVEGEEVTQLKSEVKGESLLRQHWKGTYLQTEIKLKLFARKIWNCSFTSNIAFSFYSFMFFIKVSLNDHWKINWISSSSDWTLIFLDYFFFIKSILNFHIICIKIISHSCLSKLVLW